MTESVLELRSLIKASLSEEEHDLRLDQKGAKWEHWLMRPFHKTSLPWIQKESSFHQLNVKTHFYIDFFVGELANALTFSPEWLKTLVRRELDDSLGSTFGELESALNLTIITQPVDQLCLAYVGEKWAVGGGSSAMGTRANERDVSATVAYRDWWFELL